MTDVIGGTVIVLTSQNFWDVGTSLTAVLLVQLASEAAAVGGCYKLRRFTADE